MMGIGIALVLTASGFTGLRPPDADLLFTSARDGNSEIYLLRAGQQEWINLSRHEAGDNWPVWSPEGSRIAFQSNRAGNLDIWTMKADGSEQVQLTDDPEPDYLPAWSPDGTTILFTSWRKEAGETERAPHIYAMSADGSSERRLVQESLNTSSGAAWSPDGKQIVYSRKAEKGADVYIADADGKNERRVTNDQDRNLHNGSPTFSPDGKSIAFYSDDETTSALVVMTIDGKSRRSVSSGGKDWYPRWSPDGRWLVYTAAVPEGDKGNIDLFAVPASGEGKPVLLVGSPKRDLEGSWRPARDLFAIEITTGPKWDASKPAHEQAHFAEHSAQLRRLREAGSLVMGARYSDKGLVVLAAGSLEEAKAMMDQDPSIAAGVFAYEAHPFHVFYSGTVQGRPRPKP